LDEPTSALDPETESAVMQSLLRLRGRVTVLVVTHRQSFLASADRVYRLIDGRIAGDALGGNNVANTSVGSIHD